MVGIGFAVKMVLWGEAVIFFSNYKKVGDCRVLETRRQMHIKESVSTTCRYNASNVLR